MEYTLEIGIIKDKIEEYYDGLDIEAEIEVVHRSMNWFDATATYTDKRLGTVKAHYVVLLKDGYRVEFQ
jgi:hypothetical protein